MADAELGTPTGGTVTLRQWRMREELHDPHYKGLKKLKLRGKELDRPPREVFLLSELQVLDLSPERQACLFYHLPCVPPAIARLKALQVLMLDTNDLHQVPAELAQLSQLQRLSLSNNALNRLPPEFSQLTQLRSLHMANNVFDEFPTVVCKLETLTFLDLSGNRLQDLPDEIGELEQLESLLLYANRIRELPPAIGKLTALRCLWLGHNALRCLPRDVTKLVLLDWGVNHSWSAAVDGNPLEEPPLDVCQQGLAAIAQYFDSNTSQ